MLRSLYNKENTLEFKHLEAFVKVYELKNFSKAATELFLSQPSISAYIGALEKELGLQLISRSTKTVNPTKAGALFYMHAKEMLSLRTKSEIAMKNLTQNDCGTIDILASSVPAQYILPELLGKFHTRFPNLVFNITQLDSTEVANGIGLHIGDIGFVGTYIDDPKLTCQEFMTEELVLIAPNDFRLDGQVEIAKLLCEEKFVSREVGSATRFEYEAYLKGIGILSEDLKISAYLNNTQSIIHGVANGLGLAFVSSLAAKEYIRQKSIVSIPIENPPQRKFYIVQKKDASQLAAVETLKDFLFEWKREGTLII